MLLRALLLLSVAGLARPADDPGSQAGDPPPSPQSAAQPVGTAPKPRPPTPADSVQAQSPQIGDDIEAIIRRLAAAGAASGKGEFETTSEYEKRLATLVPKDELVFVVDEWSAPFQYDADKGEMTVWVSVYPKAFYLETDAPKFPCMEVKQVLRSEKEYVGSNVFGVVKPIKDSQYDEFGIIVARSSTLTFEPGLWSTRFAFHMDRDDARARKQYLRFAVVGTVAEGRVYRDLDTHATTVSEPYRDTRQQHYLPLTVSAARVVDARSGQTAVDLTPEHRIDDRGRPKPPQEAKPPTPQRVRVDPDTQKALLIRQPKPVYPPLAKHAGIRGVVRFSVIIGKDGVVHNVSLISGHPLLVPAAQEAVKQWVYQPTLVNGDPVEVVTTIDVPFSQ